MRFNATDVFDYFKPSPCVRRVALKARNEPQQDTDTPFAELIRKLGLGHEQAHVETLSNLVNLSGLDPAKREQLTLGAIRDGAPAVYHARFRAEVPLDGETCELVGEPDFLIRDFDGAGYRIRDSKLAHNPLSSRHAGIPPQLQIYGYLYECATGVPPRGLEVHAGTNEIVPIKYVGGDTVLALLREHRRFRQSSPDEYEPVGLNKCGGCGFENHCWTAAKAAGDPALLEGVSQEQARRFHEMGIRSISAIAPAIDNPVHRDYFYEGVKKPKLKSSAIKLQRKAESYLSGKEIVVAAPELPDAANCAMFDIEGLPVSFDELDKTYLWGLKVFGTKPSQYLCAEAGFGPDGDRRGWLAFLDLARRLLGGYGPSLRFVHWSQYERTHLEIYAARRRSEPALLDSIRASLVDLLSILKQSVVLPLSSYSLKAVEKHIGFNRKITGAGGDWSIARYIEATETADAVMRDAILDDIRTYNEEDLDATNAILEWLGRLGRTSARL
jgi:uncharacterized protein